MEFIDCFNFYMKKEIHLCDICGKKKEETELKNSVIFMENERTAENWNEVCKECIEWFKDGIMERCPFKG